MYVYSLLHNIAHGATKMNKTLHCEQNLLPERELLTVRAVHLYVQCYRNNGERKLSTI